MYKKPFALNPIDHANLTIAPTTDYRFVADQMYLPIVYLEMADAAREFPIVFLQDQPGIFVLTGIEQDTNAYVSSSGQWQSAYIPAIVQNYPFVLAPHPQDPDQYLVALDADAPQVVAQNGSRLFIDGQPSHVLQQRLALLEKVKRAEPVSQQWVQRLKEAGLLVEQAVQIERDGQKSQITGILVVDEGKFNGLPAADHLELRDQGMLPLIYAHLLSMANLRQGVIAGKYPQLAQAEQNINQNDDDLFGLNMNDDTLKFNF